MFDHEVAKVPEFVWCACYLGPADDLFAMECTALLGGSWRIDRCQTPRPTACRAIAYWHCLRFRDASY
jgi:hypothetical protein